MGDILSFFLSPNMTEWRLYEKKRKKIGKKYGKAYTEEEVKMALNCGAKIIGVNNRNLKDFTVDINNCINLRKLVPENILFVGESGIKTSTDIANLKKANVNAVLIGETLMRSEDKSKALTELNGEPLYK